MATENTDPTQQQTLAQEPILPPPVDPAASEPNEFEQFAAEFDADESGELIENSPQPTVPEADPPSPAPQDPTSAKAPGDPSTEPPQPQTPQSPQQQQDPTQQAQQQPPVVDPAASQPPQTPAVTDPAAPQAPETAPPASQFSSLDELLRKAGVVVPVPLENQQQPPVEHCKLTQAAWYSALSVNTMRNRYSLQQTQQPPAQQQPAQPQVTEEQRRQYEEARNQHIRTIADSHYKMSDEMVEEFTTDPGKVISEIVSRVMLDSVQTAYSYVYNDLPQAVGQIMDQQRLSQQYEDVFFSYWSERGFDLQPFSGELGAIGAAYRQQNPNMTPDEMIANVGSQVILSKQIVPKGVSVTDPQVQDPNAQQQPTQVAAPFQSGITASSATVAPTAPANQWDKAGTELFEEDID